MDLRARRCLFTAALGKLITRAGELGLEAMIDEVNRLQSTQAEYVAKGVSKTLDSRHIDKLAADVYIFRAGVLAPGDDYRPLGVFWESLGGRWGGRFCDRKAFLEKHGREFDPSKDIGWDPNHFEFVKA